MAFHGETPHFFHHRFQWKRPPSRLDLGCGRHVTLELDVELPPADAWAALEKALRKITKGVSNG